VTFLFLIGPYVLSLLGFRGLGTEKKEGIEPKKIRMASGEVLLLVIVGLMMVVFIVVGRGYPLRVRRYPEFVALVGLLIVFWRLAYLTWAAIKSRGQREVSRPAAEAKERPVVRYQISMGLLIGYAVFVYIFGFVATTCMFVIVTAFIAGYRKPIVLGIMAAMAGIGTWVFAKVLHVILPEGMIYMALFY
jgi:hypothetical protein